MLSLKNRELGCAHGALLAPLVWFPMNLVIGHEKLMGRCEASSARERGRLQK